MSLWVVRAGRYGEREAYALENQQVVIGWDKLPDLDGLETREELEQLVRQTYPGFSPGKIANHTGQLWAFLRRIEPGDLVLLPLKTRSAIAVRLIEGPYRYVAGEPAAVRHARAVKWLRTECAPERIRSGSASLD